MKGYKVNFYYIDGRSEWLGNGTYQFQGDKYAVVCSYGDAKVYTSRNKAQAAATKLSHSCSNLGRNFEVVEVEINIRPGDWVKHCCTGEEWVVCGVDYNKGKLVPSGYPFPTIACIDDCTLIQSRKLKQTDEQKEALKSVNLHSFIEDII